jgi:hypothetical protein
MPQPLGGPGLPLPQPQLLYPTGGNGGMGSQQFYPPSNTIRLLASQGLYIPRGTWRVQSADAVGAIQFLDPVTQQWTNFLAPAAFNQTVLSDGFNFRVMNLSASAYGATVTGAGSGYSQATATVTAGTGNSTWVPVIGGALGAFTVGAGGGVYTIPPIVVIPPPPYPGVQATAHATLTSNAVSAVTIDAAGAGYLVAPPITIVPCPWDPNYLAGLITSNATATVALTGSGTLTAVLLTNFGENLSSAPTLTVNGGTSGTATPLPASGQWVAAAGMTVTMQQLG